MKLLLALAATASVVFPSVQAAKEVFAHVIVGNVRALDNADWEDNIKLAQEAKIDAFVLNIAAQDESNEASLQTIFQAAENLGFKLFFSFDYKAQGAWPKEAVIDHITRFGASPAYFKADGEKPLVSTFEGPENARDWTEIKTTTNSFFVPDWSSQGPEAAAGLADGVADGLFSFDAWPTGDTNITTKSDLEYQAALGERAYMMAVSPWFYTNLPDFNKNWLWRGDELWDTRWTQVMEIQPDFVEILTWNDYGESHYIGPVREKELGLFQTAPINYVDNMSHDGWRKFLPFYIEQYKTGAAPAKFEEGVAAYYRTAPALACENGGTTGNNEDFGEVEEAPEGFNEDAVFYAALLTSDEGATVTVRIGETELTGAFTTVPASGAGTAGIYQGSVPFGGNSGDIVVSVSRDGQVVATAEGGKPLGATCEFDIQNWNAVAV
ncbi:glycoside hydrolase [Triangularia verruculosa]|uniref:Glycoside hydrolase n=1 Tax=Triangularia verruculosa TaxID=2587418 RepID=A0AAN7ASQ1_9PEZI|nr:glycoside hydrolase [Triangularia verruculosa]